MDSDTDAVRLAFSYAWWLTGEEGAAVRAVGDARVVADDDPPSALEAVRRTAISERTMCPASELALLHDCHGLELPDAARLAEIDQDDARTELAHGRLEALVEGAEGPFAHPERLGGLAVGNPADVAHARQCEDCARARRLLEEGRSALRSLPEMPVPETLAPAMTPWGTPLPLDGRQSPLVRWGTAAAVAVLLVVAVLVLFTQLGQGG